MGRVELLGVELWACRVDTQKFIGGGVNDVLKVCGRQARRQERSQSGFEAE